jgi:hypothetical protein
VVPFVVFAPLSAPKIIKLIGLSFKNENKNNGYTFCG